jgi:hypothetical protein
VYRLIGLGGGAETSPAAAPGAAASAGATLGAPIDAVVVGGLIYLAVSFVSLVIRDR